MENRVAHFSFALSFASRSQAPALRPRLGRFVPRPGELGWHCTGATEIWPWR